MKRADVLRRLRHFAKAHGLGEVIFDQGRGKGSHGRVYIDDKATTIQDGEITPFMKQTMLKQLDWRRMLSDSGISCRS